MLEESLEISFDKSISIPHSTCSNIRSRDFLGNANDLLLNSDVFWIFDGFGRNEREKIQSLTQDKVSSSTLYS